MKKRLSLLNIEFWWRLEKLAGWLWQYITPDNEVSSWFDEVTAFTYSKRKNAERNHVNQFGENIYGNPL